MSAIVTSLGARARRFVSFLAGTSPALAVGLVLALGGTAALAQSPTLVPITVDGNFGDWQTVLVNPVNTTRDGDGSRLGCTAANDLDCPVSSTGRDLRLFAWTHDSLNVYFYVVRQGSASNTETFWFYVDADADGLMELGEKVVRVRYSGSNGDTLTSIYRYLPMSPGGDPMTDPSGFADGYTLPGDLEAGALWSEDSPNGGGTSGTTFEARVPWSVLGIPSGTPLSFHVSSSNSSNPSNIASQVDDNLGALGGGIGTFAFSRVSIEPDHAITVAGGSTAVHAHRITNTGTRSESFSLQVSSSLGLKVEIFHDTDGDGDGDILIATDASGDGDFADGGDGITAGWDADGDGYPNTPVLARGETFDIVVQMPTSPSQADETDVTTVFAYLASDRDVIDSAFDSTDIGLVAVVEDQSNSTIVGQPTSYPISVCNNGTTDTFDLDATSSSGLSVRLSSDPDCDGMANTLLARDTNGDGTWDQVFGGDSDGDGKPDTSVLSAGECTCFVVEVDPGSSVLGSVDTTSIRATGTSGGSATAHADLVTTIARRIELLPDYLVADGTAKNSGFGKPVYFAHVARNNGPYPDQVAFGPAVNDLGWVVRIWSDPDGDGSIADGQIITRTGIIEPFGGVQAFIVEVQGPADASGGTTSTTTVTGTSVVNPVDSDTVTDQVALSILATYSDPLYSFATRFFGPCDTIYVEATSLDRARPNGRNGYELIYFDGDGNVVETVTNFVPDPQGAATDEHVISGTDASGIWTIELQQDGELVSSITIEVEGNGEFTTLTTDRAAYPMTGADLVVDATLRNGNFAAPFGDTTLEYLVLDPTGTQYLVPNTPRSDFAPFTGSEATRSIALPPLAIGETFVDAFTARSVSYPSQGVYTLLARWRAACGTILGTRTISFSVGSGAEDCRNGLDDDRDGLIDCRDPECGLDPTCHETECGDGLDNDGDGDVDCADADCVSSPSCPEILCSDGIDNDADGRIDCKDSDCFFVPACIESVCSDGVDNDGDTFIDCGDSDCDAAAVCRPEDVCDDGLDNDGDTLVDCLDIDCAFSPACLSEDTDGDTVPNDEDCAPLDPGAHHVPADVSPLMVTKLGADSTLAILSWQDASVQAGDAVVYDVASGRIGELWQDRGFRDTDGDGLQIGCLAQGLNWPSLADSRRAPPSDGYYYLVTARNVCGDSGWGTDSTGAPRQMPTGLCGNN